MKNTQTKLNMEYMLTDKLILGQHIDYDFDWLEAERSYEIIETHELLAFYIDNKDKYGVDMYDNFMEADNLAEFIMESEEVIKDFLYNVYNDLPVDTSDECENPAVLTKFDLGV